MIENDLKNPPVDQQLIESCYLHEKLTLSGRSDALDLIQPAKKWSVVLYKLFMNVGTALVLSGIISFFAFNWHKIPSLLKLGLLEFGIIACLIIAKKISLETYIGKLVLLSASVLVGVFMAVFGQIYQTGADAYQLFMFWSLLILGWSILSKFSAQWVLWGVVSNIFIILWWKQTKSHNYGIKYIELFFYLSFFNGSLLILREYFLIKKKQLWLQSKWLRYFLSMYVIFLITIPSLGSIMDLKYIKKLTYFYILHHEIGYHEISFLITILGYTSIYFIYRYKLPDIIVLISLIISISIVAETFIMKFFLDILNLFSRGSFFLFIITTITITSVSSNYVKRLFKKMDTHHE